MTKPPTRSEQSAKLRAQLLKEFNGTTSKKPTNKPQPCLCKKESSRSKFLANPNNRSEPGDLITYMPALKKKPKDKRIPGISVARLEGERK
jgi:hypothetical protein